MDQISVADPIDFDIDGVYKFFRPTAPTEMFSKTPILSIEEKLTQFPWPYSEMVFGFRH